MTPASQLQLRTVHLQTMADSIFTARIDGAYDLTEEEIDRVLDLTGEAARLLEDAYDILLDGTERAERRRDAEDDCTTHDHEPA